MSKIFMTEKKIESLLRLAAPYPRDFALFHVALATGLRAGDLIRLGTEDVLGPDGQVLPSIKIKMQKTGKAIERELPQAVRNAIGLYLDTRNDNNPYLFPALSNNTQGDMVPMNRSSIYRIFKRYLEAVYGKIPELRGNACHVTRRSVAKIISDRAGRVEPATKFLGHTSIANTVAYLDMDAYGKQADEIVQALPWNKST